MMPPVTPVGGCKWLDAGCPATAVFKATQHRFAKPAHHLVAETATLSARHIGPGTYEVQKDPAKQSIEYAVQKLQGYYNPMKDATPRFGYCPTVSTAENQKPGYEHIAPGIHIDGHRSLLRESKQKDGSKCAFGLSLSTPRINQKSTHQKMMDQVWTRCDHVEAQRRSWGKTGAHISRSVLRFPKPPENICITERPIDMGTMKNVRREQDKKFKDRLRSIQKSGKAEQRRITDEERPSTTRDTTLGGHPGVIWTTIKRFGKAPHELKSEMSWTNMSHVGPTTYIKAAESDSIKARTHVAGNQSAAFAGASPRFGRKRRVDVSDGGISRAKAKEERRRQKTVIDGNYGSGSGEFRPSTAR